jgi:hypothetical protein
VPDAVGVGIDMHSSILMGASDTSEFWQETIKKMINTM